MKAPTNFVRIINRTRYDVQKATLIASNCWWDGHNFERSGTNTWLYRSAKGTYFTVTFSQWEGARDTLDVLTQHEAVEAFEQYLTEHEVTYAEAFPDVEVADA